MKKVSYLFSLAFLMSLVVLTSCGDDGGNEPSPEEEAAAELSQSWTVNTVNSEAPSSSVTITFEEDRSFTVTGAEALPEIVAGTGFPTSGTWDFTDTENFDDVTLTSGNTTVDLSDLVASEGDLSFTYSGVTNKGEDLDVDVTATN